MRPALEHDVFYYEAIAVIGAFGHYRSQWGTVGKGSDPVPQRIQTLPAELFPVCPRLHFFPIAFLAFGRRRHARPEMLFEHSIDAQRFPLSVAPTFIRQGCHLRFQRILPGVGVRLMADSRWSFSQKQARV